MHFSKNLETFFFRIKIIGKNQYIYIPLFCVSVRYAYVVDDNDDDMYVYMNDIVTTIHSINTMIFLISAPC